MPAWTSSEPHPKQGRSHSWRTGANGAVALFELEDGLILSLYPRRDLALDAEIDLRPAQGREFSLGQLVPAPGRDGGCGS